MSPDPTVPTLASWTLSQDRYLSWWEEKRIIANKVGIMVWAMLGLAGSVAALIFWFDEDQPRLAVQVLGGAVLIGAPIAAVVRAALSGRRPSGKGPASLKIMPHQASFEHHIVRWTGFGLRFVGAQALTDPPRLQISYFVRVKGRDVLQKQTLPAPDVAEAARVAAQIDAALSPTREA